MSNFGWNYPPGVTGNEYEISGPNYEIEFEGKCPECGLDNVLVEIGHRQHGSWVVCSNCDYQEDLPEISKWDDDERI